MFRCRVKITMKFSDHLEPYKSFGIPLFLSPKNSDTPPMNNEDRSASEGDNQF